MKTLSVKKSFQSVQNSAEQIKNDQPQLFPAAASPGDCFRQGDVYIELLAELPPNRKLVEKPDPQLAPGTTKGSRHILDSLQGVEMWALASPTPLDGPLLRTTEERTITHPEHGNVILPPGIYGITYQRAYADELRRVAD